MDCISTRLPYRQTGAFSKIVLDYIDQAAALKPFYTHPPTLQGIQKAIDARKQVTVDRKTLVSELKKQYESVNASSAVTKNIDSLLKDTTFTVTTAHQNNLFTGPLYFIYKIIHAIRLADHLNSSVKGNHFVPVFYMGSEDADLDELNHIYIDGQKLSWNTKQKGAVGRMKIDKELVKLIDTVAGTLTVLPYGNEIVKLLKDVYKEGVRVQDATFHFINALFGEYGLIVLIADRTSLKKQMIEVFKDDLVNQTPSAIVQETASRLEGVGYKVQANPREINLFYLEEGVRQRIEFRDSRFMIADPNLPVQSCTEEEFLKELEKHPECFSPNVILRGLYQETILPNIAFIGGGGELAYWLEFKELFAKYKVPFPVLVLRNSFFIIEKKWQEMAAKLGFTTGDLFLSEEELLNKLVSKNTNNQLQLNGTLTEAEQLYNAIKKQAAAIDTTLGQHVDALKSKTLHRLQELEKKMLRAEKRKFNDQKRQIHTIKSKLFPSDGLQERYDNLLYYYAKFGKEFIGKLYDNSLSLEQEFVILSTS